MATCKNEFRDALHEVCTGVVDKATKAEVEQLKKTKKHLLKRLGARCVELVELRAENKRLKKEKKDLESYKGWQYDEPPKDGTQIYGCFLNDSCSPMGADYEFARWLGGSWFTARRKQKPDSRLLCWRPIDWDVWSKSI